MCRIELLTLLLCDFVASLNAKDGYNKIKHQQHAPLHSSFLFFIMSLHVTTVSLRKDAGPQECLYGFGIVRTDAGLYVISREANLRCGPLPNST